MRDGAQCARPKASAGIWTDNEYTACIIQAQCPYNVTLLGTGKIKLVHGQVEIMGKRAITNQWINICAPMWAPNAALPMIFLSEAQVLCAKSDSEPGDCDVPNQGPVVNIGNLTIVRISKLRYALNEASIRSQIS